jgi:hypothetical protein
MKTMKNFRTLSSGLLPEIMAEVSRARGDHQFTTWIDVDKLIYNAKCMHEVIRQFSRNNKGYFAKFIDQGPTFRIILVW